MLRVRWRPARSFGTSSSRSTSVVASRAGYYQRTLWDAMRDPLPPATVMVEGLVKEGSNLMIGGEAGVGKSLLATQLALCLAMGLPFLGMKIHSTYKVLYVQGEMNEQEVEERLVSQALALANFHEISPDWQDIDLSHAGNRYWNWPVDILRVTEAIVEQDTEVLVLDPLSAMKPFELKENVNDDMSKFLRRDINSIQSEHTLKLIVIVHHFGKEDLTGFRPNLNRLRGGSVMGDWVEAFIGLAGSRQKTSRTLIFDKSRGFPPRLPLKAVLEYPLFEIAPEVSEPASKVVERVNPKTEELTKLLQSDGEPRDRGELAEWLGVQPRTLTDILKSIKGVIYIVPNQVRMNRIGGE